MRLARYLLTEGFGSQDYDAPRSKTLSLEKAAKYVVKNCSHALKGSAVKRTIEYNVNDKARFTDPMKGKPRISRNTSNYYTLLIDNSPKWKRYPKRSQSIIATTGTAAFFVFAENKSKYGVCPSHDFWDSFKQSGIYSMDDFNDTLEDLASAAGATQASYDDDISLIKSTFKIIDKAKMEGQDKLKKEYVKRSQYTDTGFMTDYFNDIDLKLYTHCEKLLDPNKNGFRIKFAGSQIPGNLEVWTNGKAILVRYNEVTEFLNEVGKIKK